MTVQLSISSAFASLAAITLLAGCATGDQANGTPQAAQSSNDIATRGVPAAQPAGVAAPTWPQNWSVNNREPAGFAFGVTQPGPLTVQVQSQGAPVVVTLLNAASQAVQQQTGAGTLRLAYQVTPADVQRSALWRVRVGLAQPGAGSAQAGGTITVQHPPSDMNAMRAQIQAQMAQRRALDLQAEAKAKAQMDAAMAQFQQQQAARRAGVLAEMQPQLQAARARMQGQVGTRGVDAADERKDQSSETSGADVTTRGGALPGQVMVAPPRTPTLTAILPPPQIGWISRPSAQPGDPFALTGTNFGPRSSGSKVTFTFRGFFPNTAEAARYATCPSSPLSAPIQEWNDGLAVVSIPDVSGIVRECPMEITVTRASDGAVSAPMFGFALYPTIELRQLPLPPKFGESAVHSPLASLEALYGGATQTGYAGNPSVPPGWFYIAGNLNVWQVYISRADWLGDKGNDVFFANKHLLNGWKVAKAEIQPSDPWCWWSPNSGGAYVAESRVGTDSPYLNVRVWLEPYCTIHYTPTILITGPKGVRYE